MNIKNKKIVIVGGGTAGWLSALYMQRFVSNENTYLIEDSKIDILGAGEGTTANFPFILKKLGIDRLDFFKKTKSSIKYGIDFINWRGVNDRFIHSFKTVGLQSDKYAIHFDARLVAAYFKEIAIQRGVTYIDSNVKDFKVDNDDIVEIILSNGTPVQPDFVIDCTGFARLIIGKLFKSEWKSYSNDLLVNSAFSYFLPQNDIIDMNTQTYTKSISMKYGWMWEIPLQHRLGCGYIYDDTFITTEEAIKEVEEYIGQNIEVVKTFKFNSGCYDTPWIGNCVSIGVSSGFLEPLEATSIMSTISSLIKLNMCKFEKDNIDIFNQYMKSVNEQNMLFIRHHYDCDRNDTEFWKKYKDIDRPELLERLYTDNGIKLLTDDILIDTFNGGKKTPLIFTSASYNLVHKLKNKKEKHLL